MRGGGGEIGILRSTASVHHGSATACVAATPLSKLKSPTAMRKTSGSSFAIVKRLTVHAACFTPITLMPVTSVIAKIMTAFPDDPSLPR